MEIIPHGSNVIAKHIVGHVVFAQDRLMAEV